MPRVSRRSKRRRHGYDSDHIMHLLHGYTLITGTGFNHNRRYPGSTDSDAMRLAWNELRRELLDEWIREKPGTRPYAWWKFDAPERRQRTDGIVHPFDDRVRRKRVAACNNPEFRDTAYELWFGVPRCILPPDGFGAQYESELQYLRRLDLLTDTERKDLL